MQSRGAVFGVLGALAMLMLCSGRARRGLGALLLFGALATTIYGNMGWFSDGFVNYLYRGQDAEEFRSMTGRTRAYENARLEFATAPVLGRGQWNDRLSPIVGEHVHNSFYQALLNAGILGFVPYVLSWLVGWKIWIGLWRRRWSLMAVDRGLVLECGLVMGFFTLRAIPETTTASFAVDSMVMGACYCYLETLWSATNSPASVARRPRLARPLLVGARD
jgi:O-antigen ligase